MSYWAHYDRDMQRHTPATMDMLRNRDSIALVSEVVSRRKQLWIQILKDELYLIRFKGAHDVTDRVVSHKEHKTPELPSHCETVPIFTFSYNPILK